MTQAGAEIASIREVRPTFEEVFTALVERDAAARSDGAEPDDRADDADAKRDEAA